MDTFTENKLMDERRELLAHNTIKQIVERNGGVITEREFKFFSNSDLLAFRQELVSWINKQSKTH